MKLKLIPLLAISIAMLMPASASAITPISSDDYSSLFTLNLTAKDNTPFTFITPASQPVFDFTGNPGKDPAPEPEPKAEPVVIKKPEPVIYTVVAGDNLTKIGTQFNVEWQRLWAKNTELKHPDLVYIGTKLTIPEPSEQLERDLPAVVALPVSTPGVAPRVSYDGSNTYDYGYCTWYVKNRRGASLPNMLGNANTWYSRASASGMAVGSAPRAGAVGTTTRGALGHVVYVESVNSDGTINISEMNAPKWGATTYRTANAGEFVYIY